MSSTPLGVCGLLAMLTVTPGESHNNTVASTKPTQLTIAYLHVSSEREREREWMD